MAERPSVFTIPAHRPFADALAAGLIARTGSDRLALARGLILVPNNRALRAITDAFVRRAEDGLLLPRMLAIGDLELNDPFGTLLDPADGDPIPPAIDPMVRRMLLARIISEESAQSGSLVDAAEAVRLAQALERTLDQMLVEEMPVRRLVELDVQADLSHHWQRALGVLIAVLHRWPAELQTHQRIDLADRRNRLLDQAATRWRQTSPAAFIVAAGISDTAPAVARLLRTIAFLPNGMVLLNALDRTMPSAEWEELGPDEKGRSHETHPQFHLKLLLDRMGIARSEVQLWRHGGGAAAPAAPAARSRAVSNAFAPPRFTGKWQALKSSERRLGGIRAMECATPSEEAQAVAIRIRQMLEDPGKTAALVTPDRALARRVSAHLARWGIVADDSAGRPLSTTLPGTLVSALANAAASDFAPVALLALLKHPLVRSGETRARWLDAVRYLDLRLRGPRPEPGLSGIAVLLQDRKEWWEDVSALLRPLGEALSGTVALPEALAAVRGAASTLTDDAAWAGPAGRAAAELFTALEGAASAGPRDLSAAAFGPLLIRLMDEVAIRPPQGGHPRVHVWGLIESRLQHADLAIAAGLNEGVWPALPSPDPWLSPSVRRLLGLPGLERRIGIAAHDFAGVLGNPQVLVSRARRDARSPAVASRFWLRLEAMTGGIARAPDLKRWSMAIDRPDRFVPADRPRPSPPAKDRPRRLAVTSLDRLKADPYAFYAQSMLALRALDPVDAEPSPAWRGTAVHAVLETWAKEDGCDPSKLADRAETMLDSIAAHPVLRALWAPRLREAIGWIAERMLEDLTQGRTPILAEARGEATIDEILLYGRVDRIDRMSDGSLAIIDYKTGQPPGTKQVAAGYAMQLGLLGLIAERRGFEGLSGKASAFEYWSLAQKDGRLGFVAPATGKRAGVEAEDFTILAHRNFAEAAAKWLTGDEPFVARLHPELAPYGDYDQLMRLDEWYGRQDDSG